MAIGDSITNHYGLALVDKMLRAADVRPRWVGTVPTSAEPNGPTNADGPLAEARGKSTFADHASAAESARLSILPAGGESAYLQMAKAERLAFNPFLRDGPEAPVFDFAYYLQRFGLQTPQIVLVGLGTNDVLKASRGAREAIPGMKDAATVIIKSIRDAAPETRIALWLPGLPIARDSSARWNRWHRNAINRLITLRNEMADPKIDVISVWAQMSPFAGWTSTSRSTHEIGGRPSNFDDRVHPYGVSRAEMAAALAAYIRCNV